MSVKIEATQTQPRKMSPLKDFQIYVMTQHNLKASCQTVTKCNWWSSCTVTQILFFFVCVTLSRAVLCACTKFHDWMMHNIDLQMTAVLHVGLGLWLSLGNKALCLELQNNFHVDCHENHMWNSHVMQSMGFVYTDRNCHFGGRAESHENNMSWNILKSIGFF